MKFIENILDSMEARRRRQDRMAIMIFGGGCLIFIVLGIIMVIVTGILNAVETANVKSTYGDTYASACNPVPAENDSIDNLTDAPTPREILLLTSDTQRRHGWQSDLPEQWRADNQDEVALIGCVSEDQILLETCEYFRDSARTEDGYTIRITREQNQANMVIINPRTARRIASLTVTGSEPEACPEDNESITTSSELLGAPVTWDDFAAWAEGYIFNQ